METTWHLRAPFPQPGELGDYMSPKSYAFFYRVLYGSTYLTRAMSEKALELLTTPDFTDGLVAGVPAHTTVAQKFGEHSFEGVPDTESKQLHDCGIVYHPEHPYLLCVMTKGSDFQRLSKVIKEVSETVYTAANADYK